MPFDLHMTTLPAASVSGAARRLIDDFVERGRSDTDQRIAAYVSWLVGGAGDATDEIAQRRLTTIRMHAGSMLSRFDLYADVMTQRSEHRVGIWLAGLEAAAEEALQVDRIEAPPVVCYLDRGAGAAIRRARTRLPGGEMNPVALVRIPRERMIGSGVASSLVHEVGHQGMALLDTVNSIRPVLSGLETQDSGPWSLWGTWINEILADFWSVARVGPSAVLGMMSVVSVPRAFVFRIATDDPHPFPYARVRLACVMAQELYPHRQWAHLDSIWRRLYPLAGLDARAVATIRDLERTMPALARLIAEHRPRRLAGKSLREALVCRCRAPAKLLRTVTEWADDDKAALTAKPCRALAVLGQAKLCNRLTAAAETRLLERLLTHWALTRSRRNTEVCARPAA